MEMSIIVLLRHNEREIQGWLSSLGFVRIVMKKRMVFLIVTMLLFTTGCGANYSSEEITTETAQNKFPNFSYDSAQTPYYQKDNHMIAVAENGYYFIRNATRSTYDNFTSKRFTRLEHIIRATDNKSYGKMIYFYDINTEVVTPLCSKVDCKHDNTDCEAINRLS